MKADSFEAGWFIGLYEGEGTTYCYQKKNGGVNLRVCIGMVDVDIIEKVAKLTNVGYIHLEKRPRPKLDLYRWIVTGESASYILSFLLPYLSERRREQAATALAAWEARPRKRC